MKKLLAVGIIILFIGASVVPSTGIEEKSTIGRGILYVGGSGPGNYSSIQDAIDDANPGDTIFVFSGIYNESLINEAFVDITKRIVLRGENEDNTTINCFGTGSGIMIRSNDVNISGFTIRSDYQAAYGIYIQSNLQNVLIENCTTDRFWEAGIGVLSSCSNFIIRNCTSSNNTAYGGIAYHGRSSNMQISHCNLISNSCGIYIYGNNYSIYHNNFIKNTINTRDTGIDTWYHPTLSEGNYYDDYMGEDANSDGIGDTPYKILGGINQDMYPLMEPIDMEQPGLPTYTYVDDDNTGGPWNGSLENPYQYIQDAINQTVDGDHIFVSSGIYYENVIINKNRLTILGENRTTTIIDANGVGDAVYIGNHDRNSISGFTIRNASGHGVNIFGYVYSPYYEIVSCSNIIKDCLIYDNSGNGIYIHATGKSCHTLIPLIMDCQIFDNNVNGIFLHADGNHCSIGGTMILNCNITDNVADGIHSRVEYHHSGLNGNVIIDCDIDYNGDSGIETSLSGDCGNQGHLIYHNNFNNNGQNANDPFSSSWYNTDISEGNYWSDYTGEDADGDGIGDTPYNIPGGSNQDLYPLMCPWGKYPPVANFSYFINGSTVQFDGSLSYDFDGNIISYYWDFGDDENGTGMIVNHTYDDYGTYNVTLTVTDDDNLTDNISKNVTLVDEIPPEISNIQAIPLIQLPGGYVNISAMVTDNDELDDVCVVIEYPDVHVENISILENKIGDTYYCNRTYDMIGDYTYHIWAVDVSNNDATSSTYQFTITEEFVADAGGPYSGWVNEPIQFNGYAVGGITPYSWHWDFGDGNTSDEQNPSYTYASDGNFTVFLTVTDDESHTTGDTTWAEVLNDPPGAPIINGPTSGKAGETYSYTLVAEDPNDDDVYYEIDWGDGDVDPWNGPHESNTIITRDHSWDEKGDYTIRARAKDIHGAIGDWGTLEVSMPKNKQSVYSPFLQFLQKLIQRFPILEQILSVIPFFNKMLNQAI